MLDYSLLFNNDESFTKDHNNFDIQECITEVYTLLEDKVKYKEINHCVDVEGFDNSKIINTDKKRFQ